MLNYMKSYFPEKLFLLSLILPAMQSMGNVEQAGDLAYVFNDNISNAISDTDIFSDHFLSGNYTITKLWLPGIGQTFVLGGNLGFERYNDSTGLDRVSYGTSLDYTRRLGLGAYAPRVGFSLQADRRNFRVNMRDGWLYRASVETEKRFTPDIRASLTLTRERRTANAEDATPYYTLAGGDVFNQQNNELSAYIDYTFINNSVASFRYTYRDGEINASTHPGSAFFRFSDQIALDYELCRSCDEYVAYLIDASSHAMVLDWNWALGRDASVSASYERRIAHAAGNNTYGVNIFRVQLNMRF